MEIDPYKYSPPGLSTPANIIKNITTGDDPLDPIPKSIWIGVAGDLVIEDQEGNQVTLTGFSGYLFARPRKILASSTCSNIVGFYD